MTKSPKNLVISKTQILLQDSNIEHLYDKVVQHVDNARGSIQRTIDLEMVKAYWLIGRDIIEEEQLVARANSLGEKLTARLKKAQVNVPALKEVRGLGSMIAAEFFNPTNNQPCMDSVKRVQKAALDEGLILLTCGVYGNAIRFLYPLTIQDEVFDEALEIIERALSKA